MSGPRWALAWSLVAVGSLSVSATVSAMAATVTPLEGLPLTPAVVLMQGDQVVADGKPIGILADIDWIEFERPGPATAGRPAPRFGVWLTDGSWVPATTLSAAPDAPAGGGMIRALTAFGTHDLSLASIAGWGVTEVVPAGGDLDRVVVASGPVDGRIQGLANGKLLIATSLDPEPLALDIPDILGLRLAQVPKPAPAAGTTLLATTDPLRPPTRLRLHGDQLELVASGQPASGPLLRTLRLVVDGKRRLWLSDLTPVSIDEQGAFGVVWPWTRDTDLAGGPLLLGGVRYAKGLTVHSAATLTWELAGTCSRLRAMIGISDAVTPEGDCPVTLRGDGKVLWQRPRMRGSEPPMPLDLEVRGVKRLELDIGLGERFDIGDHVVLADAYLVR